MKRNKASEQETTATGLDSPVTVLLACRLSPAFLLASNRRPDSEPLTEQVLFEILLKSKNYQDQQGVGFSKGSTTNRLHRSYFLLAQQKYLLLYFQSQTNQRSLCTYTDKCLASGSSYFSVLDLLSCSPFQTDKAN